MFYGKGFDMQKAGINLKFRQNMIYCVCCRAAINIYKQALILRNNNTLQ